MPDGELVQASIEPELADKMSVAPVDERHRRIHGLKVEFGAAIVGMRLDAPIGDHEGHAVGHQQHLVRTDPVGWKLPDTLIAVGCVIDADHALGGLEVAFGGIE